ncbi:hypothetical protein LPB90_05015 [Chryseobacterium sp. LC2016-29]|uniref:hypothetical protein n=1 Tax=Chryseobacterium sp. LC2016-29 TaxID=2897331 RepID=UPI001E2E65EF|nr:hypothetical protein [Chryseobacterium sp. LC2016-29]MCD0477803.1 hypothetical protein [Chryseobacterium sp. LC2016-29]
MKNYYASEELADILLNNGFVEITDVKFPSHSKQIKENGYNPEKAKRAFRINTKDLIIFEYITVKFVHKGNGCGAANMRKELSESELKSGIAFFKLPFQTRNSIMRSGVAIPTLYNEYRYIQETPSYNNPRNKFIVKAFEEVVL